ncbi:MAG: hypothetical protein ACWGHO_00095 [Candidatus Moraniibacteriota bacterium]|jgi:hypothetical protein
MKQESPKKGDFFVLKIKGGFMKDVVAKDYSVCDESKRELFIPAEIRDWKASIASQTQKPQKIDLPSRDPFEQFSLSN